MQFKSYITFNFRFVDTNTKKGDLRTIKFYLFIIDYHRGCLLITNEMFDGLNLWLFND